MPVIKSAIKKWRKDKKRTERNDEFRDKFQLLVKTAKKTHTPESIQDAFSIIDKATKKHLIHANKAARMKSSLTRTSVVTASEKIVKPKSAKPARSPKARTASTPRTRVKTQTA